MTAVIPIQIIENKIFIIHGQKVMLDSDLALLYGVETKVLNQVSNVILIAFLVILCFK